MSNLYANKTIQEDLCSALNEPQTLYTCFMQLAGLVKSRKVIVLHFYSDYIQSEVNNWLSAYIERGEWRLPLNYSGSHKC